MDTKIVPKKTLPKKTSLKRSISALSITDDTGVVVKKLRISYGGSIPTKLRTVSDLVDVESEKEFITKAIDIDCNETLSFSLSKIEEIEKIIAKSWDTVSVEQCKLNNRRKKIMANEIEIIDGPKNPARPTTLNECNDRQTYLDQMRNKIHERERKLNLLKKKTSKLSFNMADYRPIEIHFHDNHESLYNHLDFFINRVLA